MRIKMRWSKCFGDRLLDTTTYLTGLDKESPTDFGALLYNAKGDPDYTGDETFHVLSSLRHVSRKSGWPPLENINIELPIRDALRLRISVMPCST